MDPEEVDEEEVDEDTFSAIEKLGVDAKTSLTSLYADTTSQQTARYHAYMMKHQYSPNVYKLEHVAITAKQSYTSVHSRYILTADHRM